MRLHGALAFECRQDPIKLLLRTIPSPHLIRCLALMAAQQHLLHELQLKLRRLGAVVIAIHKAQANEAAAFSLAFM